MATPRSSYLMQILQTLAPLIIFIARKNDSGAPYLLERGTLQPGPGGWHQGRRRDVGQLPGRAAGGEATPPSARAKTRPDRGGSDRPDRVLPAGLGLVAAPDGRTTLPGVPCWRFLLKRTLVAAGLRVKSTRKANPRRHGQTTSPPRARPVCPRAMVCGMMIPVQRSRKRAC